MVVVVDVVIVVVVVDDVVVAVEVLMVVVVVVEDVKLSTTNGVSDVLGGTVVLNIETLGAIIGVSDTEIVDVEVTLVKKVLDVDGVDVVVEMSGSGDDTLDGCVGLTLGVVRI